MSTTDTPIQMLLDKIVARDAMYWGDAATDTYFLPSEAIMKTHWDGIISKFITKFDINFEKTMDFACGHGRNSQILSTFTDNVILVDVNQENIVFCKERFKDKQFEYVQTNGYSLQGVPSESVTFVYTFDAMVHFDVLLVILYLYEFYRVMTPGGYALIHHSNFSSNPGNPFVKNPHCRNYMSKELFYHISTSVGFQVKSQEVISWGSSDIDCISILSK